MLCQKWESTNYANPQAFNFHKFGPLEKVGLVEVVLHSKGENSEDWMAS